MFRKTSLILVVSFLLVFCQAWSETTIRFTALDMGVAPSGANAEGKKVTNQVHRQLVESQQPKPLQLHFLDVGQGDCILVTCPNGASILVDCGTLSPKRVVKPEAVRAKFLDKLGPDTARLQAVVITHPDTDHYNMMPYFLDGIAVDKVFSVAEPTEYSKKASASRGGSNVGSMKAWMEAQAERTVLAPETDEDTTICDSGDVEITVMAANTEDIEVGSAKNTRSVVLRLSYGKFDALLMGDATVDTEDAILAAAPETEPTLDCELQKIGHHGSTLTSCGSQWVKATSPEVSIISAALENSHGHPGDTVIRRLRLPAASVPTHDLRVWDEEHRPKDQHTTQAIYLTATNGDIDVVTDGEIYDVTYQK